VHNNFFLFRKLTPYLENILQGAVVSECYSQNKDELILRFETKDGSFFIKANLQPVFSCLSFPQKCDRARKNSVDIFEGIGGQRVEAIRQFTNERSFSLQCTNEYTLLFKMHGVRSNVILFHQGMAEALFKNNLREDIDIAIDTIDREIDWSFENFVSHQLRLPSIYFTFGKVVWKYLDEKKFNTAGIEDQWTMVQDLLGNLNQPKYYITIVADKITLSLLPLGTVIRVHGDPMAALNDFASAYFQHDSLAREKVTALSALGRTLRMRENYFAKILEKKLALQTDHNYKTWADLIMANLHAIDSGAEHVTLGNFYDDNRLLQIKLNKRLSPVKNAEAYYAKSKNQQLEMLRLDNALIGKENEIGALREKLQKIEEVHDLRQLRTIVSDIAEMTPPGKQTESLPYHAFDYKGFRILVGRNAKSNDKLTLKHTYKEDLWLHAKDVAGSHVVIKYQAGKNFPKDVIERAAQLAAYNSKRKNESLCPVIFTPRKYVRKRKGDPAGAVVVEREEVILVAPKLD